MFLLAILALGIAAVPLAGGRLSALALLRIRRGWLLGLAIAAQILIINILPAGAPAQALRAVHVATYIAAGWFVLVNRRIPGVLVIAAGGLLNLAAIASNGGVMPASASALASAGFIEHATQFTNSAAVAGANFSFLGDIFAAPSWVPLHNVFSVGDVLIVLGALYSVHRLTGSRLAPRPKPRNWELLQSPSFVRIWSAQAISSIGDWIYSVAVVVGVTRSNGTAHALSALLIAQLVPAALAGIFGGPLVDRFQRKVLMIIADVVRAGAVATLIFIPHPSLGHVYGVAAVLGLFGALFQPSLQATLPNIVREDQLVTANAMFGATFHGAVMIGPLIGALLVTRLGQAPAFAINAATFAVSALLLVSTALPRQKREKTDSPIGDLREGLRYSMRSPMIRGILVVFGLVLVAGAIKSPLEPLFVLKTLRAKPEALGLLGAVWGLGMLAGSALAPVAARRWPRERLIRWCIFSTGAVVIAASRTGSVSTVVLLWIVAGVGNSVANIAYESLLQERTPDELRGRVIASVEAASDVAILIGALFVGWLGGHAGTRTSFAVAGGIMIGAAVLATRLLPTPRLAPSDLAEPDELTGKLGRRIPGGAPLRSAPGMREIPALLGASDAEVDEPPLFLHLVGFGHGPDVREDAVLET